MGMEQLVRLEIAFPPRQPRGFAMRKESRMLLAQSVPKLVLGYRPVQLQEAFLTPSGETGLREEKNFHDS